MSFLDIPNIQLDYHTRIENVVSDFYIPVLKEAKTYKRAVGYFSSSALLEISEGLTSFINNNGSIRLLVSPKLDIKDYEAIKAGYDARKLIEEKVINGFDENVEFPQKDNRFGLLSRLIALNILSIKVVALTDNDNNGSLYHEKIGIMQDQEGNTLAFSGSANETYNGLKTNFENIDVFCSWKSQESEDRCLSKEMMFDDLWEGRIKTTITIPFPEIIKEKLMKYDSSEKSYTDLDNNLLIIFNKRKLDKDYSIPRIPPNVCLKNYQKEAIDNWEKNDYRGIFDMATGTGKTYAGFGAICRLFSAKKRLFVIICCPYMHLVDQWFDDCSLFNIKPIRCYGSVNYKNELRRELVLLKHNKINFACAIITNASFGTDSFQSLIKEYLEFTLLIVDEAHNFGADKTSSTLAINYPYRLALSATIERYGDQEGTQKLFDFFGKKDIHYTLEEAIANNNLTKYKYHPVIVYLTEDETSQYLDLSRKIAKFHLQEGDSIPKEVEFLLLRRARIIAGARNKITSLKEEIRPYKNDHNILIYCGAVKYGEDDYGTDYDGKKQIQIVEKMLHNDLGMNTCRFTAEENEKDRINIIDSFKNQELQALVAIKCLDEGMNIPAIKTAFILASSTNPKEYIQRRGRVLRKYPGKEYANIYDFVTLIDPRSLQNSNDVRLASNLAKKELNRVQDFILLCSNPSDNNKIVDKIEDDYNMNIINDEEDYL